MEWSLLFFYCIWGLALVYSAVKFAKEKYKWHSLAFAVSFVISCVIASSFSSLSTGIWFVLVISLTFAILFITLFLLAMIKHYLMVRRINKINAQLKHLPSFNVVEHLFAEHNKHPWYVLYLPLEGFIAIGVNLYGTDPVIGKKLSIQTLAGRHIFFTPEYIPETIDSKCNVICTLHDFYTFNNQTRTLVDDYILRIKNGHSEPWVIRDEINKRQD